MRSRRGAGNHNRFYEGSFPFDAASSELLDQVKGLRNGPPFSLNDYLTRAERLFEDGCNPIVEYYLLGDMGSDYRFTVKHPKPWTPLSLAIIFRYNNASFVGYGVRTDVRKLGCSLERLYKDYTTDLGTESMRAVKKMSYIMEALKMFPKESPKMMPYTPRMNFEEAMQTYQSKRKEMKKLWKDCSEFVMTLSSPKARQGSQWSPVDDSIGHPSLNAYPLPQPPLYPPPPPNVPSASHGSQYSPSYGTLPVRPKLPSSREQSLKRMPIGGQRNDIVDNSGSVVFGYPMLFPSPYPVQPWTTQSHHSDASMQVQNESRMENRMDRMDSHDDRMHSIGTTPWNAPNPMPSMPSSEDDRRGHTQQRSWMTPIDSLNTSSITTQQSLPDALNESHWTNPWTSKMQPLTMDTEQGLDQRRFHLSNHPPTTRRNPWQTIQTQSNRSPVESTKKKQTSMPMTNQEPESPPQTVGDSIFLGLSTEPSKQTSVVSIIPIADHDGCILGLSI